MTDVPRYRAEPSTSGPWYVIDSKVDMLVTPPISEDAAVLIAQYLNRALLAERDLTS